MTSWKHAVRLLRYRFWEDGEILESKPQRARGGLDDCSMCRSEPVEHAGYGLCFDCYAVKFGNTLTGWYTGSEQGL